MSAAPWTVGRYVVETLAANGIDTVFGIPGVHNLELYRGLELARLRHVLVRHEQNAGFAADGYARATGRPRPPSSSPAPGVTNILTALAQAYSDSVPLLVVASSPVRARSGSAGACCTSCTISARWPPTSPPIAGSARTAEEVRDQLRARICRAARPAPAPGVPGHPARSAGRSRPRCGRERFAGGATAARARWRRAGLRRGGPAGDAQRPLIIAGGGARAAGGRAAHTARGR